MTRVSSDQYFWMALYDAPRKICATLRELMSPHRRVCVRANCLEGWVLYSSAGAWKNEVALLAARPFARFALSFGKQNAKLNHEGDQ